MRSVRGALLLLVLLLTACTSAEPELDLDLTPEQLDWVGQQIFQNECSGRLACLVHWNDGEAFPSLGIGHFIWYPAGVDDRFVESFPALVAFMDSRSVNLPGWLKNLEPFDAPWPDRASFLAAQEAGEVTSLRQFLGETRGEQVAFIFERAKASLVHIVAAAPESRRDQLLRNLEALAATPGGVYALMDYVNFKGEGLSPDETYQGEGWGLLQVLLAMPQDPDLTALAAFRQGAAEVLTRRADHAERAIERERWLPGWLARLETYREPEGI
ncbi:hypothetical protein [Marinobacter zhejiangensis]|uniref:Uncharacterized protein n=1 Tax=Marinobacter zhejiangensis TaxID=488535 RepID=A0A1I4LLZ6_9GAMM|nr:hypothetical protein [Marinobacter zhejiangensis]SFL91995.1 hypothetical protein SAMN04487963_0548 [Marinobacter zhejiangensis]